MNNADAGASTPPSLPGGDKGQSGLQRKKPPPGSGSAVFNPYAKPRRPPPRPPTATNSMMTVETASNKVVQNSSASTTLPPSLSSTIKYQGKMRNPYAVAAAKRPMPKPQHKHRQSPPRHPKNDDHDGRIPAAAAAAATAVTATATAAPLEPQNPPALMGAVSNAAAAAAAAAKRASSGGGGGRVGAGLPYWQRLPSRSLQAVGATEALGPAEVLTVAECVKYAALYTNRPVRVTGVLQHRAFLPVERKHEKKEDAGAKDTQDAAGASGDIDQDCKELVVQLELKDPVAELAALGINKIKKSDTATTPRNVAATRSSSSRKSAPLLGSGSSSLLSNRKRKRPWFVNSSTGNDQRRKSSLGIGGIGGGGSLSRLSFGSKNGNISGRRGVTGPNIMLKVLVDPSMPQLDTVVVGSIVMIIGTVRAIPMEQEPVSEVSTRPYDGEQSNQLMESSSSSSSPPPPVKYHYKLEARLVQVMPMGSDLSLYGKALVQRRKALWKRYFGQRKAATTQENQGKNTMMLLQGCGPPPYDRWDNEK